MKQQLARTQTQALRVALSATTHVTSSGNPANTHSYVAAARHRRCGFRSGPVQRSTLRDRLARLQLITTQHSRRQLNCQLVSAAPGAELVPAAPGQQQTSLEDDTKDKLLWARVRAD